jgi:hypothetical protein
VSGRRTVAAFAACICCSLSLAGLSVSAAATPEGAEEDLVFEIWYSIRAPSEVRDELIRDLGRELARTPQRRRPRFFDASEALDLRSLEHGRANVLALLEVAFNDGRNGSGLTVGISHADDRLSPGWLVHAILRAADTVRVRASVVDSRSSWTGQLVARSTRRLPAGQANEALAAGVPAAVLLLPSAALEAGGEASLQDGNRLLAAVTRRLDGLDGPPVFEDEYLVAAGRVWLRRDLYWLCLGLWLLLFWRDRSRQPKGAGREFRWLFLVASLVAPVFASVLLTLPAAAAAWRPRMRWLALGALAPAGVYAIRLSIVLLAGARVTIDAIPAVLVASTLGVFTWTCLVPVPPAPPPEVD